MVRPDNGTRRGISGSPAAVALAVACAAIPASGSPAETPQALRGTGRQAAQAPGAAAGAATEAAGAAAARAVLDRYCVTCHNDRLRTGGLSLDAGAVDTADPSRHADVWERVIVKLRTGAMPPPRATAPGRGDLRRGGGPPRSGHRPRRRGETGPPAVPARSIGSTAPSTATRFATCSRSIST